MINFSGNLSSSRQIVFITHPSIQSQAFANYLTNTLSVRVTLHNINKPLTQRLPKESVILFDIAVSNKSSTGCGEILFDLARKTRGADYQQRTKI